MTHFEEQFKNIVAHTLTEITADKRMDVRKFRASFLTRSIKYRVQHKSFFQQFHMQLNNFSTIEEIWEKISGSWNFLNCTPLKSIICRLQYNHLEHELNEYINSLRKFKCSTPLCDFGKYLCQKEKQMCNLDDFVVHFKLDWQSCNSDVIDDLQECINCNFQIPSCCTVLKAMMMGSLIATWSLPRGIACHVKCYLNSADILSLFKKNGIKSINIDGDEWNYLDLERTSEYK